MQGDSSFAYRKPMETVNLFALLVTRTFGIHCFYVHGKCKKKSNARQKLASFVGVQFWSAFQLPGDGGFGYAVSSFTNLGYTYSASAPCVWQAHDRKQWKCSALRRHFVIRYCRQPAIANIEKQEMINRQLGSISSHIIGKLLKVIVSLFRREWWSSDK